VEEFDCGENGGHVYTTDTVARGDQDANKAGFTPVRAPGVLDNPVFSSCLFTVANKKNSVVEVREANVIVVDNAALILEPSSISGTDSDGNGSNGLNCALELLWVLVSYVIVVSELGDIQAGVVVAIVVVANVWVG